jgi:hypothetical protein
MTQTENTAPAPASDFKPYIASDTVMKEFTPKAVLLGAMFGVLFGAASVYLALKAGLTVSASIPVAVLAISQDNNSGKQHHPDDGFSRRINRLRRRLHPARLFVFVAER